MRQQADWFFDFISPFAFLQFHRLAELQGSLELRLRPILLGAVLDHWGQRGPAEIVPKRQFIYRQVHWLARSRGIQLKAPEAHPFNPLKLLRLSLHLGASHEVVERLFRFVWQEGFIPDNAAAWQALLAQFGITDEGAALGSAQVKEALRSNTQEAIASGVFGVPTLMLDGRLFWGDDATAMVLDYLGDPAPFRHDEALVANLPVGAVRPGAQR